MPQSSLRIAQITDIHLFARETQALLGLPTAHSFKAVLERVRQLQLQPDLLLLTGDLSQDGHAESYERLHQLLKPLRIPTYWLPGNHDAFPVMQQVLKQSPISPDKTFTLGGWQLLLLNSSVPGCVHGRLSAESLRWLDLQLQLTKERPTLIALHHPPFLVHSDWLDSSALQNPEELFAVLDRHPQVQLVIFGHIHQELERQRREVSYLGSPSTSIQFEPQSTKFSLDEVQPGFRLITLYPDGRWHTSIERVAYTRQPDLAATGY